MKSPGWLTYTTQGVPDKELEERLGRALAAARKEGEKRAKEHTVKRTTLKDNEDVRRS